MKTLLLAASSFVIASSCLPAADSIPNRLIDYSGFQKIVDSSAQEHEKQRLTEEQFLVMMNEPGVVVLDARSTAMYKLRHIKGAVNVPFTDFSAASLAGVLPAKNTRVLIYCNNNFLNAPLSMFSKTATASLNLSTYTSLISYGYHNINELGPLLDVNKAKIPFEGTEVR